MFYTVIARIWLQEVWSKMGGTLWGGLAKNGCNETHGGLDEVLLVVVVWSRPVCSHIVW